MVSSFEPCCSRSLASVALCIVAKILAHRAACKYFTNTTGLLPYQLNALCCCFDGITAGHTLMTWCAAYNQVQCLPVLMKYGGSPSIEDDVLDASATLIQVKCYSRACFIQVFSVAPSNAQRTWKAYVWFASPGALCPSISH